MTILSLPETEASAFASASFGLKANTLSHISDLDGSTQTLERLGARWRLEAVLTTRTRATAEAWLAFLASLGGTAGRFYAGDPLAAAPRGSAASTPGVPLVNGASQSGKTVAIDGAPGSANGYLLIGDYVAFDLPSGGRSLHKLTADADTDSGGAVSLAIAPALREAPADNAAVIVSGANCVMRLADDDQAIWRQAPGDVYEIAIAAIESFNTGS